MPRIVIAFLVIIGLGLLITIITFFVIPSSRETTQKSTIPEGDPGLFMSEDGGMAWAPLDMARGLRPTSFVFKKNIPAQFYIGTQGQGLWVTSDSGKTFSQVTDPGGLITATSDILAITQNAEGTELYLSVFDKKNARVVRLRENLAEVVFSEPLDGFGIFGIAASPQNNKKLWIASGDGNFLESVDGGKSWEIVSRTSQGIVHFLAHPSVEGKFWAIGNKNTLYTTDSGGRLWRERARITVNNGKTISMIYSVEFDPFRNSLLMGTNYGFIESTDEGISWHAFQTPVPPATLPITAVAGHPRFGEVLWMAAQDQLYRTDDGGVTWARSGSILPKTITLIRVDSSNPRRLYIGFSK